MAVILRGGVVASELRNLINQKANSSDLNGIVTNLVNNVINSRLGPAPAPGYRTILSLASSQHVPLKIIGNKCYYVLQEHQVTIVKRGGHRGDSNWVEGQYNTTFSNLFIHPIKDRFSELNLNIINVRTNIVRYSGNNATGGRGKLLEATIARSGVLNEVKVIVNGAVISNTDNFTLWTDGGSGTNAINLGYNPTSPGILVVLEVN